MKRSLLLAIMVIAGLAGKAQITLLKENKSLEFSYIQLNGKALMISDLDQTLWVTDGTPGGTIQLSSTIKVGTGGAVLNGQYIFVGITAETGEELFATDGTVAGTRLVKDISTGITSSAPDEDFAVLNSFVYFTATTAEHGRELWKTDGTLNGTSLVKDIIAGTASSNDPDSYNLFSNGNYLLFSAKTASSGVELYKSDGTEGGTGVLLDINPNAASSDPANFYPYNNNVLFIAKTTANGTELWKTNGTAGGTSMVKDINEGPANSVSLALFHPFNGKLLFTANNGSNGDELWITDGTTVNTHMVKDINQGTGSSFASLFLSIKIGNKLIFSASNTSSPASVILPELPLNTELWETDGTEAGTRIFKEIVNGPMGSYATPLPAFDFTAGSFSTSLFQGNKFFIIARTPGSGTELWISDGTTEGTRMVKDINPGAEDGITAGSYMYTSDALYFSGNNGINGSELWKSDGTLEGTRMVADINPNSDPEESDSDVEFGMIIGNKVLFTANNGDDAADDLYRLDGNFSSLPVNLSEFTVSAQNTDAILAWNTMTEVNTKDFTVQRSGDGINYENIGVVNAAGNSTDKRSYQFTDRGVGASGKNIVYYRIVTNEKDGKSNSTKTVALKLRGTNEWTVKLLTNPVLSDVNLVLSGVTEPVKLSVRDISGRSLNVMAKASGSGLINLSTSNMLPGVYILVAETSKERKLIKFVKQ